MGKKNKISKQSYSPTDKDDRDDPSSLPGWPGYRTREGRSGYDPVDTRTEAAHTAGAFIQQLFTGQLKIKNPVFLFLSGLLGLLFLLPLIVAILDIRNGNLLLLDAWITFGIAGVVGAAVLVNFVKNLARLFK